MVRIREIIVSVIGRACSSPRLWALLGVGVAISSIVSMLCTLLLSSHAIGAQIENIITTAWTSFFALWVISQENTPSMHIKQSMAHAYTCMSAVWWVITTQLIGSALLVILVGDTLPLDTPSLMPPVGVGIYLFIVSIVWLIAFPAAVVKRVPVVVVRSLSTGVWMRLVPVSAALIILLGGASLLVFIVGLILGALVRPLFTLVFAHGFLSLVVAHILKNLAYVIFIQLYSLAALQVYRTVVKKHDTIDVL